jgi:hypothetical protein
LLASDNSDSPINARNQATVDGHASLEAATPPTKESYPSYSVPWYRQGKWRVFMLIGGILIIGAIVGGVVGGTVSKKNKNNAGSGPSTTLTVASSTPPDKAQTDDSPLQPGATPPPQSTTGAAASPNTTSRNTPAGGTLAVNMGPVPSAALVA